MSLDETPTHFDVTFDRRMTWKKHIDQCTRIANLRMTLMKKLSESSWGAAKYSLEIGIGNTHWTAGHGRRKRNTTTYAICQVQATGKTPHAQHGVYSE